MLMSANKKGFFVSLAAVLLIGAIIFYISVQKKSQAQTSEVTISYEKNRAIINYLDNCEHIYIPTILKSSEKFALVNISGYVNKTGKKLANLSINLRLITNELTK